MISIITVVYNAKDTLEATINSVLNQKKTLFDYWIIDGGSTDGSLDIIRQYEPCINWISKADQGIYDAMNKGINLSQGDWLFFLGADDVLLPDVLEKITSYFLDDYKVVYGDVILKNSRLYHSRLSARTLMHNTLHHQGTFYHRSLFSNFKYNTSFKTHADYELTLRIYTQKIPACYVPIPISVFALDGASMGHTNEALRQINTIRAQYISNPKKNAFYKFLLRLYYWQKQFRFWLYGHKI